MCSSYYGLFRNVLGFVTICSTQQEKKEVGQVVVDIAKSMLKAVKGKKSQEPLPPTKTFLEKVLENTFVGSLGACSYVFSHIYCHVHNGCQSALIFCDYDF